MLLPSKQSQQPDDTKTVSSRSFWGSLLGSSLTFCFFNQAKLNPIHPLKLNLSICPAIVPVVYRLLSDVLSLDSQVAMW